MTAFTVRTLEQADTPGLLAFEVQNREWFEAHIDPRAPSFYALQGVAEQVDDYLSGLAMGRWHPFVITHPSHGIVGRANLKNIHNSPGCAEVGYRIDQLFCGQGLATLALNHLIQTARTHWHLNTLIGQVYPGNIGSLTVLERCGFVAEPHASTASTNDDRRFILAL